MSEKLALVVEFGCFSVRRTDLWGGQSTVFRSPDLRECLAEASNILGYPLVLPISGPNTEL